MQEKSLPTLSSNFWPNFATEQQPSRLLWVGLGFQQGVSRSLLEIAIETVCQQHQLMDSSIAGLATLDRKTGESGILALCADRQWLLKGFSAEQLRLVAVPTPSGVVWTSVQTPSVAEAAALLASAEFSSAYNSAEQLVPSIDRVRLCVNKQILRASDLEINNPAVNFAVDRFEAQNSQAQNSQTQKFKTDRFGLEPSQPELGKAVTVAIAEITLGPVPESADCGDGRSG